MTSIQDQNDDSDVFSHITDFTLDYVAGIYLRTGNHQFIKEIISDMNTYSNAHNLTGLTQPNEVENLIDWMMTDKYLTSRQYYIFKLTAYLRLKLGMENWNKLALDLPSIIAYTSPEGLVQAGFSALHRSKVMINELVIRQEHWFVTYLLLTIHVGLPSALSKILAEVQQATKLAERRGAF